MSKALPQPRRKRPLGALRARTVAKAEPNVLRSTLKPKQSPEASQAEFMVQGLAMNSLVGLAFSTKLGNLDLTECFAQTLRNAQATANRDRSSQESILAAQVISTNAIYTDLALLARSNLENGMNVFERLMRLALKAQSNCRATAEALALMQNPPTVFARQANIANGPQQINNGVAPERLARAGGNQSRPNELMEANGDRMDGREASATGERDQDVATVGAFHRSPNRRR